MRMDGAGFDALADDLDAAIAEVIAAAGPAPASWERARPGRWTVGGHVAHVGLCLSRTAAALEEAERALRTRTLLPVPSGRGPLQRLFLALVAGRGFMPRGGTTAPWAVPPERNDRTAALETLRRGALRHRALGARLDPGQRDRLWIDNPFRPGWHYRLPEMVRMHAVHARHHAKQIAELTATG